MSTKSEPNFPSVKFDGLVEDVDCPRLFVSQVEGDSDELVVRPIELLVLLPRVERHPECQVLDEKKIQF